MNIPSGPLAETIVTLQNEIEDRRWKIVRAHDEIAVFERAVARLQEQRQEIDRTYGASENDTNHIAQETRAQLSR